MRDSTLILVAAVVMLGTGFWITGLILLALTCVQVRMTLKWLFEVIGIAAVICVLILFAAYGLLILVEGI